MGTGKKELTFLLGSVEAQKPHHSGCLYKSEVSIPGNQPIQASGVADRVSPGPVLQMDYCFLIWHAFSKMRLLSHKASSGSLPSRVFCQYPGSDSSFLKLSISPPHSQLLSLLTPCPLQPTFFHPQCVFIIYRLTINMASQTINKNFSVCTEHCARHPGRQEIRKLHSHLSWSCPSSWRQVHLSVIQDNTFYHEVGKSRK